MKRITLLILAFCTLMMAQAQDLRRKSMKPTPVEVANAKLASAKVVERAGIKARGPKKVATANDYAGTYKWEYQESQEYAVDPSTVTSSAGSSFVTITAGDDNNVTISGMSVMEDLSGQIDDDGYLVIPIDQYCSDSDYGKCNLSAFFYYEGDDEYEAGWYYSDVYAELGDDGVITFDGNTYIYMEIAEGDWAGYRYGYFWMPGSTMTPSELPTLVELPEGLEVTEYASWWTEEGDIDAFGYVNVAIDGQDVYFQGLASSVPDAWIKGTLADGEVVFPGGQYLGNNLGNDYFLQDEDVVLERIEGSDNFSCDGSFGVVVGANVSDYFNNLNLFKTEDKADMPIDPVISEIYESEYGPILYYTVPTVGVSLNGMASDKLFYRFYVDIDREVSQLTFPTELYTKLEAELSTIPVTFTDNYDIYSNYLYLNMDTKSWNKIGIQSVYLGGGEENETEIQWFTIKDYPEGYTFDFNAMDVATSTNDSSAGDITSDLKIDGKNVSLTISPASNDGSTPTRFWDSTSGPQLRCYDNTLTFTAEEGYVITKIVFSYNGSYWGGKLNAGNVTADSGEITDGMKGEATWEGEAESVVFTIGANTQLNSIMVVTKEKVAPTEPIVIPEGIEMEDWYVDAMLNSSQEINGTVKLGFDGNYVYIQGLTAPYISDGVLRGELSEDGTTLTIPRLQFVGNYESAVVNLDLFVSGYYSEDPFEDDFKGTYYDLVFKYDAENKVYTTDQLVAVTNNNLSSLYFYFANVKIYKEKEDATAIAGVSASDGKAVFYDMSGRKADANARGMLIMQTRMSDGTVKTSKVFRK